MYVGSTGERGLYPLVFEITDLAVNEVLAGRAGRIGITLTPGGGVRVADDGPGIPVEGAGHTGGPGLETLLTSVRTGPGPGGRQTVGMGLFGIGPCVTNALSSRLTAEIRREGTRWVQEYARGIAAGPATAMGPATGSGTTITFRPDAEIFGTAQFSFAVLAERFRELAFLNRALDVSLTDERTPDRPHSLRFHFPGGVRDFVAHLGARAGTAAHTGVIAFEAEDPRMAGTVEAALQWRDPGHEQVLGFANSRPTAEGGTHLLGLRDGVAAALGAYARRRRLLPAGEPDPSADRIGPGLTAVVSVKLDHPEFLGATRGLLGGDAVRACVTEAVRDHLGAWLEENPQQAGALVERVRVRSDR
ncbi:ATP-binding protein [Actinacidiphila acididurans]|uniref:DNA topoisomerase (ATP-hydrolyzing) n=1 Tax=Actinacidiphila acididurans TaxID=2784346 RepID=A0ABS2U1M8_9ACTN|nr:ATP-binding protein [Actinacidiphila acididurans]MBM9509507.1 DNA gyrase subunit B [Actinacidiphila acididurans]